MRKIILIILSFMIFLSCRGTVTSPNNIDNNGNTTEPPITEEELNEIINKVFDEVKPESSKDMGKIMKTLKPKVNGTEATISKSLMFSLKLEIVFCQYGLKRLCKNFR